LTGRPEEMGSSEDSRSLTEAHLPEAPEEFGLTIGRLEQEKRSQTDSTGSPEVMGSSEDRRLTKAGPPSEVDRRLTKAGPPSEVDRRLTKAGPPSEEDRRSTKAGPPE
jgi:hypothetical protein